jgi:hypothetical protein
MIEGLVDALRERNVILFAGAGVSLSLGMPSHQALIDALAEELGYEPEVFRRLADFRVLAEYYVEEKGTLGPLRSSLDVKWHGADIDIKSSLLHELIVKLDFPLIYTTNYDRWLELALEAHGKRVRKIVNVADLKQIPEDHTQVVKFHGDFDDDNSIVLSEESYFERLSFESALDIKLRSDALGRSILFLGYSLSDVNVRYMLFRLQQVWSGAANKRPQSYILLNRRNPVEERVLARRGVTALFPPPASDVTEATIAFLEDLLRRLSLS